MGDIAGLPNIGEVVEKQLNQVGIFTLRDLETLGTEKAWLKIQSIDESACIHRLYSLEGAIRGIKKKDLPADRKAELREFYQWHKK